MFLFESKPKMAQTRFVRGCSLHLLCCAPVDERTRFVQALSPRPVLLCCSIQRTRFVRGITLQQLAMCCSRRITSLAIQASPSFRASFCFAIG